MKILKLITFLLVANTFANPADETSRSLHDAAHSAKEKGDYASYLSMTREAAKAACVEITAGKLRFADAAPLLAEALAKPQPEIAAASFTDALLLQRAAFLNKLRTTALPTDGATTEEFKIARQTIAKASIHFYAWVNDASQLKAVERAKDEVKAAQLAFDELPKSVRTDPDAWDNAINGGFDHIKNPELKKAMQRSKTAKWGVEYARSGRETANRLLPGVTRDVATVIRALYAQAPDDRAELDRLLTESAVNEGPLAEVLRPK